MKALVKTKKGFGNLELQDIPEPVCKDNEIKIKIKAVGICGTDLHIYEGTFPYYNTPVILGHEFSGEIVQIGKAVKNYRSFKVGDKVVGLPSASIICGNCSYCRSGNFIFCPERKGMGHGINGAMTELVCMREELVYKLPDKISFETGTLLEPLSCCVQSIDDFVKIPPLTFCLVSGAGSIGMIILSLLKLRNCKVVLAGISRDFKRFEIARKIGADIVIDTEKESIKEKVLKNFGRHEFDLVFECAGSCASLKNCIKYLKKMGSILQIGLYNQECKIDINDIVIKQLSLYGTLGFTWGTWGNSLKLLENGNLNLDYLITGRYRLEDWNEAFRKVKDPDSLKILLMPERH